MNPYFRGLLRGPYPLDPEFLLNLAMNQSFQRANNIAGWLLFAVATVVYLLTIEATASFWDCGEFIPAAFKQQIVHPPGAPIFLMVGRMFIVVGGEANAAVMMNAFSALCTSFSVLFLFWTCTWMVRKVMLARLEGNEESWNEEHTATALIAGGIAALTATFSTSMWFSAVEAEVYAMATFFFALLFWAMTRWERVADRPGGDRWLLFIGLMVGLSGGVHLLSLLALPALVFMYYFRRYETTRKGTMITTAVALGILIFILYFVLDWMIAIAAGLDVMFVNNMGLPFHTGIILFTILMLGLLGFGIYWTSKNGMKLVNTAMLGVLFMMMGFGSYAMVLIRAEAQPSINMNGISDVHSFLSYLKREQYGSRSLLSGPYFTARPVEAKEAGNVYRKGEEKYEIVGKKQEYIYDLYSLGIDSRRIQTEPQLMQLARQNKTTFFPRMGSADPRHKGLYFQFLGLNTEQEQNAYTPNFGDNMRFFFQYQIGHMFWRYFMWNFSGRQNDRQGYMADGYKNGNWITGVSFLDVAKHGQLRNLAQTEKDDFARDTYFMLPFILGLLGFTWHMRHHPKGFTVLFLFWLFMGIMNIINMNQPPIEPRERDYALVGAFFAWAFWVGMGFMALLDIAKKNFSEAVTYLGWTASLMCVLYIVGLTAYSSLGVFIMLLAYVLAVVAVLSLIALGVGKALKGSSRAIALGAIAVIAPLLMASQNWDNHDRSNRTFARDVARNYLESCAPDAILFTQGDNDTYPLWYAQEVEGIRPDVRIINLSLLGVDWYINNLRRAVNESAPIRMTLPPEQINGDKNNYIGFCEESKYKDRHVEVSDLIQKFVLEMDGRQSPCQDDRGTLQTGAYMPSQLIKMRVDKEKILENGLVTEAEQEFIVDELRLKLRKKNLLKNDLMVLDIVSTNMWDRPIYFAMTVQSDSYLGLQKYFRHDGMCYQFMPIERPEFGQQKPVPYRQSMNTNVMYDLIMSDNFTYGGLEKGKGIYRDPSTQNALMTLKYLLYQQLAYDLISEATQIEQLAPLAGLDSTVLLSLDVLEVSNAPTVAEQKRIRAGEVLDRMLEKFPHEAMPYDVNMVGIANMLEGLDKNDQAKEVALITQEVITSELDWLLTIRQDPEVSILYERDLFGPPAQQICAGDASLTRMGTIGAAGSLIKLYERLGDQTAADNLRAECATIIQTNTLAWPVWMDKSCRSMLLRTFGLQ